jgi:catechol 2,3-dioxygenase-like lactoylglutathione lyase family enzyme
MLKFASVAVVVSDAKKAATWYRDVLGLEGRAEEGHWVTVASSGANVELHLCEGSPLEPGNTGIAFVADDVQSAHESLRDKGVEFSTPPTREEWGTYAMFKDPDGNEFWLVEG